MRMIRHCAPSIIYLIIGRVNYLDRWLGQDQMTTVTQHLSTYFVLGTLLILLNLRNDSEVCILFSFYT